MTKKYLVIEGNIKSKNDNNLHFVSAEELLRLYNVNKEECLILKYGIDDTTMQILLRCNKDLVILKPQESGNYTLPIKEQNGN